MNAWDIQFLEEIIKVTNVCFFGRYGSQTGTECLNMGTRDTGDMDILNPRKLEEVFGLPPNTELVRVQGYFTQDTGEEEVPERDLDHMHIQ